MEQNYFLRTFQIYHPTGYGHQFHNRAWKNNITPLGLYMSLWFWQKMKLKSDFLFKESVIVQIS